MGKVICGDALEVLKDIPDESIDMIFTDPPYGHNNNNGDLISRREAALGRGIYEPKMNRPIANDGKEANELFRLAIKEFNRVLKPGSCCCCCCCGGGPDPQFARWSLWIDNVMDFKQMVVWDKGPMGMGWHYRRSYETILVAQKKGARCYWFDSSKRIENVIRYNQHGVKKIIPRKTDHPTQKPVSLPSFFISLHTTPGMLVLDPFCGSGSTLEAAKRLGRDFIGIELNQEYVDMAKKRIGMGLE